MSQVQRPPSLTDRQWQDLLLNYLQNVLKKQRADVDLEEKQLTQHKSPRGRKHWLSDELHASRSEKIEASIREVKELIPGTKEQIRRLKRGEAVTVYVPPKTDLQAAWMFVNYYRPSMHGRAYSSSPDRASSNRAEGQGAAQAGSSTRGRQQQRGPHHDSKHRGASRTKCAVM